MNIKEYQPVSFSEDLQCKCNSIDAQLVQDADTTQFQFELDVCNELPNLISDGDFDQSTAWTADNWTISDDSASSTAGVTGELSQECYGSGQRVALEMNITSCVGGPLYIYFGQNLIKEITQPGYYKVYGKTSTLAADENNTLRLISSATNSCTIESVASYPLEENFALLIMDRNSVILDARTIADDEADANYTFFRIWENVVTVSFDWDYITDAVNGLGLDYGCYRLGLSGLCENTCGQLGPLDPSFNIPNALPTADTYPWAKQAGDDALVIDSGVLTFTGDTGSVITETLEDGYAAPCEASVAYDVTLVIDSITNAEVIVQIGGTQSATYNTSGTKTFSVTSVDTSSFRIIVRDSAAGTAGSAVISKFAVEMSTNDLTKWTADNISNMFTFQETHVCTLLLTASNNEDAFGLKFGGALYNPQLRVKSTLRPIEYPSERSDVLDSNLEMNVTYYRQRKARELRVNKVPEYLVDWLSLWRGFSNVFVGSEEYIAENDNFEIKYNRFCDASTVKLIIGEKRQALESDNKSGQLAFTNINNILLEVNDIDSEIVLLDNTQISING